MAKISTWHISPRLSTECKAYYQSPNKRACSFIVSQLFPHPDRTLFGSARFLNYHQFLGLQDRFSAQTTTSEERKNKEKKTTEKKNSSTLQG